MLAQATPARSGDKLAGICAASAQGRIAAQMAIAELPLQRFLDEAVVPYETDEVTRVIFDVYEPTAFASISSFTVGDLRDWLLSDELRVSVSRRWYPALRQRWPQRYRS